MDLDLVRDLIETAYRECINARPLDDCPRGGAPAVYTCNECLREAYFDDQKPAVDYSCERRRLLYIVRNLAPGAWTTYHSLRVANGAVRQLWDRVSAEGDVLRVTSIGCGPGSDFLGTMAWAGDNHWFARFGRLRKMELVGLDRLPLWKPPFYRLMDKAIGRHAGVPVAAKFDDTGEDFCNVVKCKPHVVQCSWLWSEFGENLHSAALWNRVVAQLDRPCLLVLVDRADPQMMRKLRLLLAVCTGQYEVIREAEVGREGYIPLGLSPAVEDLWPRKNIKFMYSLILLR